MAFLRTGTCNRCGECCGYPRASDGGQNNAWDRSWPESLNGWEEEYAKTHYPILQFGEHMLNTPYDNFNLHGHRCYWIWVWKHGLCTDLPPYGDPATYDQRCPLLDVKQEDGTVPCLLVGTSYEFIWSKLCAPIPPNSYPSQEEVDIWFTNCPSCSYGYVEE